MIRLNNYEHPSLQNISTVDRVGRVLASMPMQNLRTILSKLNSTLLPTPILQKDIPGPYLRLMFPVETETVTSGTVVSVVALYDTKNEKTLYVHPMYAGPNANPLFKNLDGPMAAPKSQAGKNGGRAILRFLEQKNALWERFCGEKESGDANDAQERWRALYFWALKMLYFCAQCQSCQWGDPAFDSPTGSIQSDDLYYDHSALSAPLPDSLRPMLGKILSSDLWKLESDYVKRGGWELSLSPFLVQTNNDDFAQVIFPTNARSIQSGTIVALHVFFHIPSQTPYHIHSLVAGAQPEILFMNGEALSLPSFNNDTIQDYKITCAESWKQFRLNELEFGLPFASTTWLIGFWQSLEKLSDGNQIPAHETFFQKELEQTQQSINPFLQNNANHINRFVPQELPEGHVIKTLYEEHDHLLSFINELEQINNRLQQCKSFDYFSDMARLKDISKHLIEAELHHRREEEIIFPMIANHDSNCPDAVMMREHDELHTLKNELHSAIYTNDLENFNSLKVQLNTIIPILIATLREHIFKENNFIYPAALAQQSSAEKWQQLKIKCDEIGYCNFNRKPASGLLHRTI